MSAFTIPRLGCEFDRFLYASVGEDSDGMPLTVLSALARVDVDPWEEASKLTHLPKKRAVTRLALLLGAVRNVPAVGLDPAHIAAALITLLPCPRDRVSPMLKAVVAQAAPTKNPAIVTTLLLVTYMIFMLLAQWLMGGLETPGGRESSATSTSAIDSSSTPTSSEGPRRPIK